MNSPISDGIEKVGIVTRINPRYIYVWDNCLGVHELRFPLKSIPGVEPGDFVYYCQNEHVKGVQYQRDIRRFTGSVPIHITKRPYSSKIKFFVRTAIVFPPPNYSPYIARIRACEKLQRCHAIVWSLDFHEVALYSDVTGDYEPNIVYEAEICRLPTTQDEEDPNNQLIETVNSLFCVAVKNNGPLKIIHDDEVLRSAPWNRAFVEVDEDFMIGLNTGSHPAGPQSNGIERPLSSDDFRGLTAAGRQVERQPEKIIDFDVETPSSRQTFDNVDSARHLTTGALFRGQEQPSSRQQQSKTFLDEGCGLIVRLASKYAVIWSAQHGLVCAYGACGVDRPLGTWVTYKCREDPQLRVEGDYLTKSAYHLRDIQSRRESYKFDNTVKCQAKVQLLPHVSEDSHFVKTTDDEFGIVLCSRDPFLISQFRNNSEVEVFTIFMEDYHRDSSWIAIAANYGDNDWRKLDGLPDRVDAMAERAFTYRKPIDEEVLAVYGAPSADAVAERRFRPPESWQSFRHVDDHTIEDVLGVIICHEEPNIAVAFTIFGLARLHAPVDLGTWLRMCIREEPEHVVFSNISALTPKNFRVLRSEKIPPPMSTRVVKPREEEKVLICGVLISGYRCLENAYLGQVLDPKHLIPRHPNKPPNPKGFLAEFSIFRRTDGWYWEVLKYHRDAVDDVDFVPLQLSVFMKYEGRTCDDPHTLLVDTTYVDPEFAATSDLVTPSQPVQQRRPVSHAQIPLGHLSEQLSANGSTSTASLPPTTMAGDAEQPYLRRSPTEIRTEVEDLKKATMAPAQYLFDQSDRASIAEELNRYRPRIDGPRVRGMCVITKKTDEFALAYSKKFQIVLIKPDIFPNIANYHELCQVGEWINSGFAQVQDCESATRRKLKFNHIATPIVRRNARAAPHARLINGFVQLFIVCEFNDKTVRHVDEEPSLLVVETILGNMLISDVLYRRNEFHNTSQSIFVTHIREKHGCHWKYVPRDTLVDFEYKYQILEKEFKREDEEERRRQERIAEEKDLLLLNDVFEEPSRPAASLLATPLTPQELLDSFGAKPTGNASSASSLGVAVSAAGPAKVPMISELAVEELQSMRRRPAEAEQQQLLTLEKTSPTLLVSSKPKVNYHYAEAEDEVHRMNKSDNRFAGSSLYNGVKSDDGTQKYSSPELISSQNSIDTCSTSPFNGVGQNKLDGMDEPCGNALINDSVDRFDNSEAGTPEGNPQLPSLSHLSKADLRMLQKICTLNSENSDNNDEEEVDEDYDESFDDGIIRIIDGKDS